MVVENFNPARRRYQERRRSEIDHGRQDIRRRYCQADQGMEIQVGIGQPGDLTVNYPFEFTQEE